MANETLNLNFTLHDAGRGDLAVAITLNAQDGHIVSAEARDESGVTYDCKVNITLQRINESNEAECWCCPDGSQCYTIPCGSPCP